MYLESQELGMLILKVQILLKEQRYCLKIYGGSQIMYNLIILIKKLKAKYQELLGIIQKHQGK